MTQLEQLAALTEAKYQQAQQKLQAIAAQEASLRAELSRLANHEKASQAQTSEPSVMHALGAEGLWQGWLTKARIAINMKLAQVLAQKEQHLASVRKAHGRAEVSGKIYEDAKAKAVSKRKMRDLNGIISDTLY